MSLFLNMTKHNDTAPDCAVSIHIRMLLGVSTMLVVVGCRDPFSTSCYPELQPSTDSLEETDTGPDCLSESDCDSDGVNNREDCNEIDPTQFQWAYLDEDGDGYRGSLDYYASCVGNELPANTFLEQDPIDCDDNNDAIWQSACLDEDGDTYCALNTELCTGGDLLPGYVTEYDHWDDCDDENSSFHKSVYEDNDGDHEYSDTPSRCASEDESKTSDFSFNPGADCDDHDPLFATYRPDVFGDGIDDNCDGEDGFETECEIDDRYQTNCFETSDYENKLTTTCESAADLAIIDYRAGGGINCYPFSAYMTLANLGGVTFDGGFSINYANHSFNKGEGSLSQGSADPTHLTKSYTLTLAPGEFRNVVIDPECVSVSVVDLSQEDCDPYNNSTMVRTPPIALCK